MFETLPQAAGMVHSPILHAVAKQELSVSILQSGLSHMIDTHDHPTTCCRDRTDTKNPFPCLTILPHAPPPPTNASRFVCRVKTLLGRAHPAAALSACQGRSSPGRMAATAQALLVVPLVLHGALLGGSQVRVVLLKQRAAQVAGDLVRDAAQGRVLEQRVLLLHRRLRPRGRQLRL